MDQSASESCWNSYASRSCVRQSWASSSFDRDIPSLFSDLVCCPSRSGNEISQHMDAVSSLDTVSVVKTVVKHIQYQPASSSPYVFVMKTTVRSPFEICLSNSLKISWRSVLRADERTEILGFLIVANILERSIFDFGKTRSGMSNNPVQLNDLIENLNSKSLRDFANRFAIWSLMKK